jgi:hypothetical protein
VKRTIALALLSANVALASSASAQQLTVPQEAPQALATSAAALPALGDAASEHQIGVGVRIFPESSFGIGGGIRYFMGGNLGFQAEVAHFSIPVAFFDDISANQFNVAAIYRISEHAFANNMSLIPYAGAGVNFLRGSCPDNLGGCFIFDFDAFEEGDENSVGALVFGGAELFIKKIPNLSVSGEITFTSNNDLFGGGGRGTIAAHWYFK